MERGRDREDKVRNNHVWVTPTNYSHLVSDALLQVGQGVGPVAGWDVVQWGAVLELGQGRTALHLAVDHATGLALLEASSSGSPGHATAAGMGTPVAGHPVRCDWGRSTTDRTDAWCSSRGWPWSTRVLAERCGTALCISPPRLAGRHAGSSWLLADAVAIASATTAGACRSGSGSGPTTRGRTILAAPATRSHVDRHGHPLLP